MILCTSCNTENQDSAKFCKKCGTGLVKQVTGHPCSGCGAQLQPGAKFCKSCGKPTASVPVATPEVPAAVEALAAPEAPAPIEVPVVAEAPTAPEPSLPQTAPVEPPPEIGIVRGTSEVPVAADTTLPPSHLPKPTDTASADTDAKQPAPKAAAADGERDNGKQLKMIIAGAVAVVLIGGGLFWWQSTSRPAAALDDAATQPTQEANTALPPPVPEAAPPTRPSEPAVPSASIAPAAPPAETAPATTTTSAPVTASSVPVVPAPDHKAKVQATKDKPDAQLSGTINALLKNAESYLAANQYDKAIATAESVLAIDATNRTAKALVSKAKARQMDALKSNSSLE